jgi:hypothetical protein
VARHCWEPPRAITVTGSPGGSPLTVSVRVAVPSVAGPGQVTITSNGSGFGRDRNPGDLQSRATRRLEHQRTQI